MIQQLLSTATLVDAPAVRPCHVSCPTAMLEHAFNGVQSVVYQDFKEAQALTGSEQPQQQLRQLVGDLHLWQDQAIPSMQAVL